MTEAEKEVEKGGFRESEEDLALQQDKTETPEEMVENEKNKDVEKVGPEDVEKIGTEDVEKIGLEDVDIFDWLGEDVKLAPLASISEVTLNELQMDFSETLKVESWDKI